MNPALPALSWFWQAWLATLVFVFPISPTIALWVRNDALVSLFLLLLAPTLMAGRRPRFVLLLLAVATLGGVSLTLDARWRGFAESAAIGRNSPSHYWLTPDPTLQPTTPSGAILEESAYMRAAWAHRAVTAIAEQPLGLGFGRDAFGRAIEQAYGQRGMVSSHSGWLNFALGAGLMLSLLVGSYLLRCLLDGHLSGWRLGLFAFLCGVLVAAMRKVPVKP